MPDLVDRIKKLAQERLMTLRDLATQSGISRQTIYYWGKGRTPDPDSLRKVAAALNVTVGVDLFEPSDVSSS